MCSSTYLCKTLVMLMIKIKEENHCNSIHFTYVEGFKCIEWILLKFVKPNNHFCVYL